MGCYIEFLILKEKILEIAGEEISMPVTVCICLFYVLYTVLYTL